MLRDPKIAAEKSLRRSGPQAYDDFGFECGDLGFEPRTARGDFGGAGFFVDAALAARFPLEMFDGVGDVDFPAVDASFGESGVEQLAGRAYERAALEIFLIARLFADEHDF